MKKPMDFTRRCFNGSRIRYVAAFAINRHFWKNRPRPTVNKREKNEKTPSKENRRHENHQRKTHTDHTKIRPENATRDGTEEKENATETTTNA